ncbi:MAG: methionine ABC transporter ATP-binding protein [Rickettsiales bacterium]|nr:methionine ABC transporter ATP-binding protein [Rickettsiales bacterium]|tara:strand:- start:1242 stop:2225 length:984 start_codon:yes stop_codon:yes gene_type:complete
MNKENLIEIQNLEVVFESKESSIKAVDNINLSIPKNTIVGIVGESGSGKSTTGLSILNLIPDPGVIKNGSIYFNSENILTMDEINLRKIRGKEISMIFQDPQASLNPSITIGTQITEILETHSGLSKKDAEKEVIPLLSSIGLPDPKRILKSYSFQLSGGMCQRIMLAMAVSLKPQLLIADEPTSNLDTTLQAAILQKIRQLKNSYGITVILITHDMGVIAQMADYVAVMYKGIIVEMSETIKLFKNPRHPYTQGLLDAIPRIDDYQKKLYSFAPIDDQSEDIELEICPFIPRCKFKTELCKNSLKPALKFIDENHSVACFHPIEIK